MPKRAQKKETAYRVGSIAGLIFAIYRPDIAGNNLFAGIVAASRERIDATGRDQQVDGVRFRILHLLEPEKIVELTWATDKPIEQKDVLKIWEKSL